MIKSGSMCPSLLLEVTGFWLSGCHHLGDGKNSEGLCVNSVLFEEERPKSDLLDIYGMNWIIPQVRWLLKFHDQFIEVLFVNHAFQKSQLVLRVNLSVILNTKTFDIQVILAGSIV